MQSDYGALYTAWIRNKWAHEAIDFTPWLVANLHLVSNSTGLDLHNLGQEVSAAGGRVDIVAWDSRSKAKVVIENQLSSADARHLQQLVSYGESLQARIRIWIAGSFDNKFCRLISEWNQRAAFKTEGAFYFLLRIEPDRYGEGVLLRVVEQPTQLQINHLLLTDEERETRKRLIEEFWNTWNRSRSTSFKIGTYERVYVGKAVDLKVARINVQVNCSRGHLRKQRIRSINRYAGRLSKEFPKTYLKEEWRSDEVTRNLLEVKSPISLENIESWEDIRYWFSYMEKRISSSV